MINFLSIKKRKISIFLLLIFNQFLFSSYAINSKKINKLDHREHSLKTEKHKGSKILLSESINEENQFDIDVEKIEKYVEEVFGPNNLENFKEKVKDLPLTNGNPNKSDKYYIKTDIDNKSFPKDEKNYSDKLKHKKNIKINDFKKENINKIPLPSKSIISTTEFKVPPRGYLNLNGPKITLNIEEVDSIETLKLIGKLGNYGIVIVEEGDLTNKENLNSSKITANFDQVDFSEVFNSILLSANLQAILENNIIFVGKNILNKSIKPKVSKTYRLNQVNAASVADYLSSLGAQISKVLLVSGTLEGSEVEDGYINKKEFKNELKDSYSVEGGPLFGLIGTTDLRLQTITLIGSNDLINTAEKYIKSLDLRHRQVALTIKIMDVSLNKTDIKDNIFELRAGDTRIINNSGLGLITGNKEPINSPLIESPDGLSNIKNVVTGGISEGNFINWLEAKIINENAKVLASPTLILGENPNILSSGAASVNDELNSASIGRPFKNEGFIKVGETVITGFSRSVDDGVVTCEPEEGTAGITFGAKVEKIDDNGFVTFALSPAISAITKTVEVPGCGLQNTLSLRKLDTGSIRVKNGDTLILTGVLKDEDNITTSKVPIFGDIPILGSLFRKNSTLKRKSELIILVTPKILKD